MLPSARHSPGRGIVNRRHVHTGGRGRPRRCRHTLEGVLPSRDPERLPLTMLCCDLLPDIEAFPALLEGRLLETDFLGVTGEGAGHGCILSGVECSTASRKARRDSLSLRRRSLWMAQRCCSSAKFLSSSSQCSRSRRYLSAASLAIRCLWFCSMSLRIRKRVTAASAALSLGFLCQRWSSHFLSVDSIKPSVDGGPWYIPVPGRFSGPSFMTGQLQEALVWLTPLCTID